ncbi:MAG: hypothetical protein LBR70_07345 [Lactobacillaceae bacterium]|jgi:hypothetical protein|nr:hypothetical protein [Lactobacillaceae bacterium]
MIKKILFTVLGCAISFNAHAQQAAEAQEPQSSLRANFKRISLDLSSTEVKNADLYQNSSVSALSADGESIVKGVFDFALEYQKADSRWDNSLYMIYGKKKTKPYDGPNITNKSDDQILLTTDYAHGIWNYHEAKVGPFVNLGYETNFTTENGAARRKIFRGKTGLKLFDGKYFSDLYIAAVGEYDMTYDDNSKFGAEIGMKAKFPVRDGVDFEVNGYYREYLAYSKYEYEDLKYDLNAEVRMNVLIVDDWKLSLSPFAKYRMAESRGAGKAGSNFSIGISLMFNDIYNIW